MKEKLEIFELSMELAKALGGDKEAIANIALLYVRHPEMFKNIQDVIKTIDEVVRDPEIIIKGRKGENDDSVFVAKQLNTEKMGDVAIKNENGTNVIFHANKKKISELIRLKKKWQMVGTPTSYTQAQSLDGRLVQKNISSTTEEIIPQDPKPIHSSQPKVQKLIKVNKSTDKAMIPTRQRKR